MSEFPGSTADAARRHGRHRDHHRRNRALVAVGVVLAVVAAGLVTWWVRAGADPDPAQIAGGGGAAGSAGQSAAAGQSAQQAPSDSALGTAGVLAATGACDLPDGKLTVAAAPEIAAALANVGSVRAGACAVDVRSVDPAAMIVDSGGVDVWLPDSSMWLERAAAAGRAVPGKATSIANSPVVLAVPAAAAKQLGAAGTADIGDILATRAGATPIRVGLPDPWQSAPAVGAILAARAAVTGTTDARAALTWAVRSSPPRLPIHGEDLLRRLDADPGTALPVSEQQVVLYDRSNPTTPAVAVYQRTGGVALNYPLVALRTDAAVVAAATELTSALTSGRGRDALQRAGFRAADGRAGAALGGVAGVDPSVVTTDSLPALSAIDDAIRTAQLTNEPSRMLAVMDVSGSMQSQVPGAGGASRMDLAKEAAARGLALYPANSEIGLWVFSRKLEGASDRRELVPVGPLGTDADDSSGAARLAAAVASINAVPEGGTALYDTVLDAVRTMRAAFDPTKVNAVLILSDGVNDDEGSISLDELLKTLAAEQDPARPVPVISIAFGPDSDVQALGAISGATGGAAYQSRDPKQISEIFLDAVGQRLCRPGC